MIGTELAVSGWGQGENGMLTRVVVRQAVDSRNTCADAWNDEGSVDEKVSVVHVLASSRSYF